MNITGEQLIGNSTSREGSRTFTGVNPETGSTLEPTFVDATADEIARALDLAADAHPTLKSVELEARARFLERIADEIEDLGNELLERASAETALPIARLTGERARTTGQLRLFAEVVREGSWVDARIDRGDPARKPAPKPDVRRMLIPIGPVVVFGASNFPLAFSVAGGDTVSALAAGCPVVVKAHPNHPGTSEMVGRAILGAVEASGLPEGTFSMVQGVMPDVGLGLVRDPRAKAVGFTGSLGGGRALFDAAAARPEPIPVYAEMGSTNPLFLLPRTIDSRGEAMAAGLVQSVTAGVGQFCTNPGVIVALDDDATSRFLETLDAKMKEAADGTMLHAGIRSAFLRGVERLESTAGMERRGREANSADVAGRCRVTPTLFTTTASIFLENPDVGEEVFGPSTVVVRCASIDEMRRVASALRGQLTAGIHGADDELAEYSWLVSILEEKAGRLLIDGFPTGVEVCHAMQHGGPYPATTDSRSTSVGTAAISRFARPVAYQNFPQALLPEALRDGNPLGILRMVDGTWSRD